MVVIGFMTPVQLIAQQQDSTRAKIRSQIERSFNEVELGEDDNGEQLLLFLEELAANPVNVNSASIDRLLQVPGFNLKLAQALIQYRSAQPLEQITDLMKVPGIGRVTFERMSAFVTIGGSTERFRALYLNPDYWTQNLKPEYLIRYQQVLEEQEGYKRTEGEGGYIGSAAKVYQRIRVAGKHLQFNMTQEKDAGEPWGGGLGFDYTSAHLALKDNGRLKDFVIGDFALNMGQGLVMWNGGAFGKGREVVGTVGKNERGVRGYSSAQESGAFRGVAFTYGGDVELTGFYSRRNFTASIVGEDSTRFPSSAGFHRTQSERDRRYNTGHTLWGGRVRAVHPYGIFGATYYGTRFDDYIVKGSALSAQYDFEGKNHSVAGLDYKGIFGQVLFFGEVARSENGGIGWVSGLETSLGSATDLSLLYRDYAKDFQSIYGAGFGEQSSAPQNEEGFYIGLRHVLNRKTIIGLYADQYQFEAPISGIDQPSQGFDVLADIEWNPTQSMNTLVLFRMETKDKEQIFTNNEGREESRVYDSKRISARIQLAYQQTRSLRWRTRFEQVWVPAAGGEEQQHGVLLYQDLRIQPNTKLKIDVRVTLFDTDSFDARVYQFENDLLYVLSNKALSDTGKRMYAVVNYEWSDNVELWLKYSVTQFQNTQVISSGLNQIIGDTRSDIGVQMRLKF